jgi:hypothetical protein
LLIEIWNYKMTIDLDTEETFRQEFDTGCASGKGQGIIYSIISMRELAERITGENVVIEADVKHKTDFNVFQFYITNEITGELGTKNNQDCFLEIRVNSSGDYAAYIEGGDQELLPNPFRTGSIKDLNKYLTPVEATATVEVTNWANFSLAFKIKNNSRNVMDVSRSISAFYCNELPTIGTGFRNIYCSETFIQENRISVGMKAQAYDEKELVREARLVLHENGDSGYLPASPNDAFKELTIKNPTISQENSGFYFVKPVKNTLDEAPLPQNSMGF